MKPKSGLFSKLVIIGLVLFVGIYAYLMFHSYGTINDQISKSLHEKKNSSPTPALVCPQGEYINCMPVVGVEQSKLCSKEYLTWAQKNCPGFKGAAY